MIQQGQSQLRALQQSKDQSRQDIEVQTKKLLQKREEELSRLSEDAEKEIKGLKIQLDGLKPSVAQCEKELISLKAQISDAKEELKVTKAKNDVLKSSNAELNSLNVAVQGQYDKVISEVAKNLEEVEALKRQKESLQSEIANYETQASNFLINMDRTKADFEMIIKQKERQIALLEHRITTTQQDLLDIQKSHERERRELADRKLALDKQDENLRIRAHKVSAQEEAVSRNASLLEL